MKATMLRNSTATSRFIYQAVEVAEIVDIGDQQHPSPN